jgi:hypothetical protein
VGGRNNNYGVLSKTCMRKLLWENMLREPEGLWTAVVLNVFTKRDNAKPLWLGNAAAYRLLVNNRMRFSEPV